MRIAAVSDIHGNLGALEAVLLDIEHREVDLIVNLGDLLSGPLLPAETADRLMALGLPTISGNHERQLLADDFASMAPSDRHAAVCINEVQRRWLEALPSTRWVNEHVLLCHATPDSDVACYLEDIRAGELIPTTQALVAERTGDCRASLIFCGHTHIPRTVFLPGGQTIVNPGSVGIQAYHGNHPEAHTVEIGSPHARYAIVEWHERGWSTQQLAVPYDWEAAARLAEANQRPDWARALRTGYVR